MIEISRRKLLRRALKLGAGAAASSIIKPALATNNPTGVLPGAIRWDPWYGSPSVGPSDNRALGWPDYQFRAPWFAKTFGKYAIDTTNGNHQEIMDLECLMASTAGIAYWMWDWYPNTLTDFTPNTTSQMLNSWKLYQTSANKNLVKWCFMMGISGLGFNRQSNYNAQMITYMSQSNYMTVLTGRPLYFIFIDAQPTSANGYPSGWATLAAQLAALRTAASTAGIGNPYIVIMEFTASGAFADFTNAGADAISSYTNFTWGNYAGLVTSTENLWTAYGNTGAPFIPFAVMGGDTRPRNQFPPAYNAPPITPPFQSLLEAASPGTIAQRAQHAQDCINFVANNPVKCPANAMIMYSWTECDEGGGCLIPTLGDPPQSGNTTNILSALSNVFH